jgi:hypothetical protein
MAFFPLSGTVPLLRRIKGCTAKDGGKAMVARKPSLTNGQELMANMPKIICCKSPIYIGGGGWQKRGDWHNSCA